MSPTLIDFSLLEGPVFTGRRRGEQLRKEFNLDTLDTGTQPVIVKIPENTYAVTSSFFLGMFGPSLLKFGSTQAFYRHYSFILPEHLKETTQHYAEYAVGKRVSF